MSLLAPLLLAIALCNRQEDNAVMHIVFFSMYGAILWVVLFRKQNFNLNLGRKYRWLVFAFIGYTVLLAVNPLLSKAPYYSIEGVSRGLAFPMGFFLALMPCAYRIDWPQSRSARASAIIAAFLAAWGIAEFSLLLTHVFSPADWAIEETRTQGPYMDINLYGAMMNVCLLAALGVYLQAFAGTGAWCVLALLSLAAATPQSRGATLALLAILPALYWVMWKDRAIRKKLSLGIATIVAGFALVHCAMLPFPQQERQASGNRESNQCRLLIWNSTFSAWKAEGGLLGTGIGTYRQIYPEYRNPLEICSGGTQAHNDYLQDLLEGGPLLLAIFIVVAPLGSFLVLLGTRHIEDTDRRSQAACFAAAALTPALHALVNFIYVDESLGLACGFCIGTALQLSQESAPTKPIFSKSLDNFRDWLRPLVAVAFLFYLVDLASDYFIFRRLVEAPKNDQATIRFANFSAAWMPWNPFPHLFLAGKMYNEAVTMEPGLWKDFRLVFAYREMQQLIRFDRHNYDAWIHLSQLLNTDTTLDPETSSQAALSTALIYDPASYDARTALARQKLLGNQTKEACHLMRAGLPWLGLEAQTARIESAEFLELGKKICQGQESQQGQVIWTDFIKWLAEGDFSLSSYESLIEGHRGSGILEID